MDNMYKVNQELSSDSQKFRLDFYFQATSEGEALLSTCITILYSAFCAHHSVSKRFNSNFFNHSIE